MNKIFFLIFLLLAGKSYSVDFIWTDQSYYITGSDPGSLCNAVVEEFKVRNPTRGVVNIGTMFINPTNYYCYFTPYSLISGSGDSQQFILMARSGDSCPSGQTLVPETGLCETPLPPQCQVGQISDDCPAVICTNPAGSVGWGQSCPPTNPPLKDYGCITSGSPHECDPNYPLNGGNGTSVGTGPNSDIANGGGTIVNESGETNIIPASNGSTLGTTSGSSMTGSGSGGASSGGSNGNSGFIKSGGVNTPMADYCNVYPDDPACSTFNKQTLSDLCSHGGAPDPVIGCDYVYQPPIEPCPLRQVPDVNGDCVTPPQMSVSNPPSDYIPPTAQPPSVYPPSTTTNSTTSTTTTYTTIGGNTTINIINEPASEEETGPCDPTSLNYLDCLITPSTMPENTVISVSSADQSLANFKSRIDSAPVSTALSNIINVFGADAGACSNLEFDLTDTPINTYVSTPIICELAETSRPVLAPLMLVVFSIVGFRVFGSS